MKTIATFLIVALLGFLVGCNRNAGKSDEQDRSREEQVTPAKPAGEPRNVLRMKAEMLRDLKVTTAEVESRPGGEGSMLLGELRVNENSYAEVGAPIPSRIVLLYAGIGQFVKAGQALALLQSVDVGKSRADVITAKSRLDLAKQVLERKQRLAAERIVAEREVQEAKATTDAAEAELRAARSSLRALGTGVDEEGDSSRYTLRSPVSGTVIDRTAVQGQRADGDATLFRIGDLSILWLTVQAFERDAIRIKPGSQVKITLPALPGTSLPGKVDLIGRQVDPDSRTLPIRIVISNKDGQLRPGMSATTWVTPGGDATLAITVPASSLQRLQEEWVVFIPLEKAGEFEVRKVGRGRDLSGEIEILNGVKAGERVVVDGAFLLKAEAEKAHGEGEEHAH